MKYSIIIPVYNCEQYLEMSVHSILDQHREDTEIILVDDGSTDQSGSIADALAEKTACVKVYHKLNGGAASARNYGLTKAAGEWILFIDGDDTVDGHTLEEIDQIICKHDVDLITFGMSFDYYRGNYIQRSEVLSCAHQGEIKQKEVIEHFKEFFMDNALSSGCNKVFCRELIETHKLSFVEGMTVYEDFEFVLNYLKHCKELYYMDKPFYHYRIDLQNQHSHGHVRDLEKLSSNMKRLLRTMSGFECEEAVKIKNLGILTTGVNLVLQLLDQHLYANEMNETAVQRFMITVGVENYIKDQGIQLGEREQLLYDRISNNQYDRIRSDIKKRKWKSNTKKFIKRIIGRQ